MKASEIAQMVYEGPAYAHAKEQGVDMEKVKEVLAINCSEAELEFARYCMNFSAQFRANHAAVTEKIAERETIEKAELAAVVEAQLAKESA